MTELTTEYRGQTLTATLHKHETMMLWYVSVDMGLKIPFDSKMLNNIFTRDYIKTIAGIEDEKEYTRLLLEFKPIDDQSKCELLSFSPHEIEIMWSIDGKIQIEKDASIMAYVTRIVDIVKDGGNEDLLRANKLID